QGFWRPGDQNHRKGTARSPSDRVKTVYRLPASNLWRPSELTMAARLPTTRRTIMSAKSRLLIAEHPHYLVRRSSNNQPAFLHEADFTACRADIRQLSADYDVAIHAYCLLPEELHIVATPRQDPFELARFM